MKTNFIESTSLRKHRFLKGRNKNNNDDVKECLIIISPSKKIYICAINIQVS